MTQLDPQSRFGSLHNAIGNMAMDVGNSVRTMPGLMLPMLREEGWRKFKRDLDGYVYAHDSIASWVLGPAWGGLNFPDWATLYAILECNLEKGPDCIRLLIEAGAPDPKTIADALSLRKAELVEKLRDGPGGNGANQHKRKSNVRNANIAPKSQTAAYNLARLKRDRPDLARRVTAGEMSANAAAIEAGFRKGAPSVSIWSTDSPEKVAEALCAKFDAPLGGPIG
jgi:hypothetical protein